MENFSVTRQLKLCFVIFLFCSFQLKFSLKNNIRNERFKLLHKTYVTCKLHDAVEIENRSDTTTIIQMTRERWSSNWNSSGSHFLADFPVPFESPCSVKTFVYAFSADLSSSMASHYWSRLSSYKDPILRTLQHRSIDCLRTFRIRLHVSNL